MPFIDEIRPLVAEPREDLAAEYKGGLNLAETHHRAVLAKAAIAIANHGGGYIIMGMRDDRAQLVSIPRPDEIPATAQEMSENGRRGVGTTNHCMHGPATILEEILDWRPFDYVTLATLVPNPGAPKILLTYAFADHDGGTRVEVRVGKPKSKDKAIFEQIGAGFPQMFEGSIRNLRLLVENKPAAAPVVEEPVMPVLSERFLTQPVHTH